MNINTTAIIVPVKTINTPFSTMNKTKNNKHNSNNYSNSNRNNNNNSNTNSNSNNRMLMHGLILVTILATATSAEAEITMEAAFQGHCGHTSPCEQLCYEIHDGMYECDCIEGYELNKNGYSCQVINSTSSNDSHSKSDEDVLYQKGASFSAKLADDNQLSSGYASSSSLSAVEAAAVAAGGISSASGSDEDSEDIAADNFFSEEQPNVNSYISSESISFINEEEAEQRQAEDQMQTYSNSKIINRSPTEYKIKRIPIISAPSLSSLSSSSSSGAASREQRITLSTTKPLHLMLNGKPNRIIIKSKMPPLLRPSTTSSTTTVRATIAGGTEIEENINSNGNDDNDDYYSKQDMSIYDDVNNNQLNLRPLSHNTYQTQYTQQQQNQQQTISKHNQQEQQQHQYHQLGSDNNHLEVEAAGAASAMMNNGNDDDTASKRKISENTNISNSLSSIGTISNYCSLDCGLDGVCDNSEGNYRCLCPFGKNGNGCTEDLKVRVPKFSKKSWLAFPPLRAAYKHVQIRVEFRPEAFDGIILLSGERDDLTGDFMALLLNKGFVEFWFDCGSGVGSVRSRETILLNEWNSLIIYRHRWDAWLVLNHGTKVQGRSKGLFSRITFREPVFLGGTGNITGLAKRLPVENGFVGCIRRFVTNEHEYKFEEHPLGDVKKGYDIQDCITDKCFKYPCQHGGKCLPSDQGAVCLCPMGFVGDLCEIRMDLQVPAFNGSSFLRYAPLGDSALIWLELKVILKPEQPDGLILYSGPEKHGDFIALCLTSGFVEFTFDLGSGPAVVRSEYPLTIGQWHTIKISRTARLAVLKVDQYSEVMTISSNGFWHLSLPENLFLGGVNHVDKLPLDLKYNPFFVGCIQRIDINGHSLAIVSEALGGTNIGNCPHACVARPCGPLAECVPQMEGYECRCNTFNEQCNKAAEVPVEELQISKTKTKNRNGNGNGNRSKQFNGHEHEVKSKKIQAYKQQQQLLTTGKIHGKGHTRYLHKITQTPITTAATTKSPPLRTSTSTSTSATKHAYNINEDDIEDDIIFRDVHGMHKKYGHNEHQQQKQQQQQEQPERQRNENAKSEANTQTIVTNTGKSRNISKYQSKAEELPAPPRPRFHGIKHNPNHKAAAAFEEKLSRLPTHYESFQTSPDSDILTFGDSLEIELTDEDDADDDSQQRHHEDHVEDAYETESEPFILDDNLFDENDGTEEYHRKQLAQDMARIMANTHEKHAAKKPQIVLDISTYEVGYNGAEEEADRNSNKSSEDESFEEDDDDDDDDDSKMLSDDGKYNDNDEDDVDVDLVMDKVSNVNKDDDILEPIQSKTPKPTKATNKPQHTSTPQTQTDWSLLKKLDFDFTDKFHRQIGVRKNFGACFAGKDSYFHYNDAETMSQVISYNIDLNLRIKTHSDNGVILWTGRQSTGADNEDFLSLGIEEGFLHFRYDLGSGEANIRFNMTKVSDGLWHRVRAIRNSQEGYLEVDGRKSPPQCSPGKLRQLNTDTGLYVGGMPNVSYFTRRKYDNGIVGCISEIVLAGELKLNFDPNTLGTAHNVETGIL